MAAGGSSSAALSAILVGGTGATGNCLLGSLLQAKDRVGKVTVLTRRKVEKVGESYGVNLAEEEQQGRLVQHVEDLEAVSEDTVKQLCTGAHVFFNCLGTTKAKAGSAEAFRHIDYEIPLRLIQLARQAGVGHCSLLTSAGANPNSWLLYMKTKGVMEEDTKKEKFEYTSIFRPGFLQRGEAASRGIAERVAKALFSGLPVSSLAEAMLQDALKYHSSKSDDSAAAATNNVATFNNAAIRTLAQDRVGKVTVLTRRKVEKVGESYGVNLAEEEQQGRLVQHVEDLDAVSEDTVKQLCTGAHVFFNCLGTTRAKAGSAEAFRHIDYEIPVRLIQLARQAGVGQCSIVTSPGANPNGWFVYTKTKGLLEEDTKKEKFEYTSIFRPGVLHRGDAASHSFGEKVSKVLFNGLPVSSLAEAMLQDALKYHSSKSDDSAAAATNNVAIFNNAAIRTLAQEFNKKE